MASMLHKQNVVRVLVIDAQTITASGSYTSDPVNLNFLASDGVFSLHYVITGNGTAKFEYLMLNEATGTYIEPSEATDIGTGKTVGNDILSFTPVVGRMIKIKATETGAANTVTITAYLIIQ